MREGELRKLANSSLVLVLCQVRFSPLEKMDDYAPEVQDRLRRMGFPLNLSKKLREIRVGASGVETEERHHWEFSDRAHRQSFILDKNFATYLTTGYDRFDSFFTTLADTLDVLDEVVEGFLVTRVGLRYVNVIRSHTEEHSWRDFVREGLRGAMSEEFVGTSVLHVHQTQAETRAGRIAIRLVQNRDARLLPPDMEAIPLQLRLPDHVADVETGELLTLLDVDHFQSDEWTYERSILESVTWALKNISYHVTFGDILTDHALEQWS